MRSTRRRYARVCQPSLRLESHWLDDADTLNNMLAKADAMAAYTRHLHDSAEINNAIQFGRLAIEAGLGRVMVSQQGKGGGRGKKGTTETSGREGPKFSAKTLKVCRKIHKNAEKLPEYESDINAHNESLSDDSADAMQASTADFLRYVGSGGILATKYTGEMEWYTPEEYIERCREAMSKIDCDPASSKRAQKTVKAKTYYTAEDNSLARASRSLGAGRRNRTQGRRRQTEDHRQARPDFRGNSPSFSVACGPFESIITPVHPSAFRRRQDIKERKKYARCIFCLVCVWLAAVLAITTASGTKRCPVNLSDAVLIALISGVSVNVIALFAIVTTYLFPKR